MNQKTSKVEKEFYLRCSYLTLSVLFDKEPLFLGITLVETVFTFAPFLLTLYNPDRVHTIPTDVH